MLTKSLIMIIGLRRVLFRRRNRIVAPSKMVRIVIRSPDSVEISQ